MIKYYKNASKFSFVNFYILECKNRWKYTQLLKVLFDCYDEVMYPSYKAMLHNLGLENKQKTNKYVH